MTRRPCRWCQRVQTTAEDGWCASCRAAWTKLSWDEAEAIVSEHVEEIDQMHRDGAAWVNISAALKRKYGEGPRGWGWHWALLVAATGRWRDERRVGAS